VSLDFLAINVAKRIPQFTSLPSDSPLSRSHPNLQTLYRKTSLSISRMFARRVYNSIPWSSMNNGTSAVSESTAIAAVEVPSCIRYSATLRWHLRIMSTIMQTPRMRAYSGISRRYDKELAIRGVAHRGIYDSIWNRFSKYSYECRTFRRKWI